MSENNPWETPSAVQSVYNTEPASAQQPVGGQYHSEPTGQYAGAATTNLPGRGGAIAMLVSGLVMMFLIAPIIAVIGVVGSVMNSADSIESNTVVLEKQDSVYISVIGPSEDIAVCGLISEDGKAYEAHAEKDGLVVNKVPAGVYDVVCDNTTDADIIMGFSESQVIGMVLGGMGISVLIAFIVGTVGLILLIVGIVKLVKVNKKRRMMANPYGW